MALLLTETVARAHRAVQRGEHFHTDETLLLGLPIVMSRPMTDDPPLFSLLNVGIESFLPQESADIGSLLLTPEALYLKLREQNDCMILDGHTLLQLTIAEPQISPSTTNIFSGRIQTENRIQVGTWGVFSVRLRHPREQQRLIQLLQSWYEQRIPVRESYQGQRTFLLKSNMSYEEIQAFKQRYGVKLYG